MSIIFNFLFLFSDVYPIYALFVVVILDSTCTFSIIHISFVFVVRSPCCLNNDMISVSDATVRRQPLDVYIMYQHHDNGVQQHPGYGLETVPLFKFLLRLKLFFVSLLSLPILSFMVWICCTIHIFSFFIFLSVFFLFFFPIFFPCLSRAQF